MRGSLLTRLVVALVAVAAIAWPTDVAAQGRRGPRGVARPLVVRPAVYGVRLARPWYPFGFYGPAWGGSYGWGWGAFGPAWGGYPPYWGALGSASYGSVRLQVQPRHAEVFVDGYFAGQVDDFDGAFQRLNLPPGEHEIQIFLEGYRSVRERLYVVPGRTSRVRSALERQPDGEPPEARPEAAVPTPDPTGPTSLAPGAAPRPSDPGVRSRRPDGRAFGRVVIRVQPADAQVLVDGEGWQPSTGQDRLVVNVPPGAHRIEVRREGYLPYSVLVDIAPGATETINVSLTTETAEPAVR